MSFPLAAVFTIGEKLIDRLLPDPKEASDAKLKLLEMQQSGELAQLTAETEIAKAQISVNLAEAQSDDKFARRWRPFIGWVCGVAFAYHFVLQPLIAFTSAAFGHDIDLPTFDMDALYTVLGGMLGLGGMRTVERVKGIKAPK